MFSMLAAAAFTAAQEDAASAGRISCMRCEHLDSPLGIDSAEPRLSWRLPDGISKQTRQWLREKESTGIPVSSSLTIYW